MSLLDRIKSFFSQKDPNASEEHHEWLQRPTVAEPAARQPTPEEMRAAASAEPLRATVEPVSEEPSAESVEHSAEEIAEAEARPAEPETERLPPGVAGDEPQRPPV